MAEELKKSLVRKKELVASYRAKLERSGGFVVLFNFQGIDALPLSELRAQIRSTGGEIVVGRNTLFYRAFEKGGLMNGRFLTPQEVVSLAELPGREELIAKLMSVLTAPVAQLAMTLRALPQKLVLVLKAIEEQKS